VKTPRAKCLEAIQKLARVAAADDNGNCQCVSCGEWDHWKNMDGGHFIPKGHSSYWALQVENVHPQCKGCNGFGMKHGTAASRYTLWMQDYYGRDFIEEMEATKRNPIKLYKGDYETMLKEFNEQINHHLKRLAE